LGGPIIAAATLSRFFALHVFVIPGALIAFVGLHLLLVLKLGINEWPMPGRIVRRATYMQEYHDLTQKAGVPFVPGAIVKDMFFSAFILMAIAACAVYFGPFGPSGQPDPTKSLFWRPSTRPVWLRRGTPPALPSRRRKGRRPMSSEVHGASLAVTLGVPMVVAIVYVRGWYRLRRVYPELLNVRRLAAFLGGLFFLWAAIGSPLAGLDHQWLTAHMAQHLLVMTVAAPLILWGAPVITLLHGFLGALPEL
jgi:hypothetical protein